MLNAIINFSVRNKLIILLFVLGLIGYGSYEVTRLPIDAVPDITNTQVQIITVAPALGAPDIERLITFPIEQANSNISGLLEIRSFSRFGLSLVTVVFDDNTDIYWARQQIAERLQQVQAQIPQGVGTPELGPVTTGLGEIYQYVVRPKKGYEGKYNETDLRTIQDWIVRRQLLGVKGVADVSSFGGKLKQYEVAVNPAKLKSFGLTISDVFSALEKNNENTGGAYIEKGSTVQYIRSEGLINSLDDLRNVAVTHTDKGNPVYVRDVADVQFGHATRYGAMSYNDKGEVAGAVVMMLKGENSSEVIRNVKERVAQIQQTLPEGVVIEPFLDRTKMVNNAIGTVEKNLLEGALIVVFVLVLFLGNVRAGLLVASVIPLAMLFAIIMMNLFGVSGNLMSLGALDFGLIVDGAVIIVESVMHRLASSPNFAGLTRISQKQMDEEVNYSAGRMMNSAVFGQIIILIVYLPIFTLEGIEGKMFKPMAQTVAFALLGAFILSLTYIPTMSALFLSKKVAHKKNFSDRLLEFIEKRYQILLDKILSFPKLIVSASVALLVVAVLILSQMGGEFIPALEEGDFALQTRVLPGSNLNVSLDAAQKASKILLKYPEVEKVVAKIGSGEIPTDPMPMEAQDLMIILKDKSEWTSAKTFPELAEKMSHSLEDVTGVSFGFQFPVQMRFNELMTGARQDVVCKIFGEDLDTLALYSKKLGAIVETVDGAKDLYIETITGTPQIIIEYNRAAIAEYALNIKDINQTINTAFAGQSSGLIFEGERRFDLVVRLAGDQRQRLSDIQNLLIPTPNGSQIPLYQVANVSLKEAASQIQREDAKRRIVVGFNVRGRDVQSIVQELQQKIEKKVKLPSGYYIVYGGAFENLQKATQRLSIAVPVSLLLIFLMLYFAFSSVRQGLLIYSAIPLSAIGGIFALAGRGMPFSISAGVGFIALFGVAVLNGIVLVAEFNRIRHDGQTDLRRVVLEGTSLRLRPVLMTAFVASLGFLPMAVSNGAGAEVQRPLATVVIGGLMLATLLTLFVLPALYMLFEKNDKRQSGTTTTAVSIVLLLLFGNVAQAQTPISLQAALDSAVANNLSLKTEKLMVSHAEKLKKSGVDIAPTDVSFEYGQFNSIYKDNKISLAQNFQFPTVYKHQKELLSDEWKKSLLVATLKENELKKQVRLVYSQMLLLEKRRTILQRNDSILSEFVQKSTLRFRKGESNVLEANSAELTRGQIALQLQQVQHDYGILQAEFRYLLNTHTAFVPSPAASAVLPVSVVWSDTAALRQHPHAQLAQQQRTQSLTAYRLEKARLLPNLMLTYNNMTIRGIGSDDVYYGYNKRFQSVQLGVGIPLWAKAQKGRIAAANIAQQIAESSYQNSQKQLQAQWQQAQLRYQKAQASIGFYEQNALQKAQQLQQLANLQLNAGQINYLDWTLLISQSISIQTEYLNAIEAQNREAVEIYSLLNK